jgi:nicotinamide-nucleotide amidase
MFNAEIITVGSELMLGQTVDTHSAFLSRECAALGIPVRFHTSVGDDRTLLLEVIRLAHSRSDLVFLCGGLGPTLDDLTKETLAEFMGVQLVQDSRVKESLERYFAGRSQDMPANNYKQAYVFPGGTVFPNDRGTAPGLAVEHQGVTFVLLPGPPRELVPMFEQSVLPFLLARMQGRSVIFSHSLSFFGIGESYLEERLKDLITSAGDALVATYAKDAGVTARITVRAATEEEARRKVEPLRLEILRRVGKYCFSEKDETLEEAVLSLLKEQKRTVAVAESCTGGLLAHLFTSVPGSSEVFKGGLVSYSNEGKERLLRVPGSVLAREGAVSATTAALMAEHARELFGTDFALSVTGVAGPDPVEGKEVGLVFIGFAEKGKLPETREYRLKGMRQRIQLFAAKHALFILQQRLKKGENDT